MNQINGYDVGTMATISENSYRVDPKSDIGFGG